MSYSEPVKVTKYEFNGASRQHQMITAAVMMKFDEIQITRRWVNRLQPSKIEKTHPIIRNY